MAASRLSTRRSSGVSTSGTTAGGALGIDSAGVVTAGGSTAVDSTGVTAAGGGPESTGAVASGAAATGTLAVRGRNASHHTPPTSAASSARTYGTRTSDPAGSGSACSPDPNVRRGETRDARGAGAGGDAASDALAGP